MPHTPHPFVQHLQRRPGMWAGVIICVTTLVRVWFVATHQLDLVQDEAHYWDWTRHLQLSYYSKGPLIAYLISLGTTIFGATELGVRSMAIAGSAAIQGVVYWGLAQLWGRPLTALWALLIANTMLIFMAAGILMTTDNPLLLGWVAGLFLLYAASTREKESSRYFWLLAAAVAWGIWAKYTMLVFPLVALVYSLGVQRQAMLPRGYWPRLAGALGLGVVLGLVPIVLWNAGHDWVGFRHVLHRGGVESAGWLEWFDWEEFPEYLGSQIGVLTPWWFVFLLLGAWGALKRLRGPAGVDGMGLTRRQAWLLNAGFWPVWLFFVFWSLHTHVEANWSAVSYGAGIVLAALAWQRYWERARGRHRKWRVLWPTLGLVLFVLVHAQNLMPLPAEYNPAARLKGWHDLGAEVHRLQEEQFVRSNRVFVFSDRYNTTAALSFYVPGQKRAFCVNTGRRLNQYDFWPGPVRRYGWDAIYVQKEMGESLEPEVRAMFARVSERIDYRSQHRGAPAQGFSIYLCYGYNGQWPDPPDKSY